jgi:hypothetical protein
MKAANPPSLFSTFFVDKGVDNFGESARFLTLARVSQIRASPQKREKSSTYKKSAYFQKLIGGL